MSYNEDRKELRSLKRTRNIWTCFILFVFFLGILSVKLSHDGWYYEDNQLKKIRDFFTSNVIFTIIIWGASCFFKQIFISFYDKFKKIRHKVAYHLCALLYTASTVYHIIAFGYVILFPVFTTQSLSFLSVIICVSLFLFVERTFLALILPPPIKIKRFFSKIFAKK